LKNISIIIPVFNAASFVAQAAESALAQPETAEVILVEDGSPDDSLQICLELAEKYEKVRLLQHPGGVNKGAGASRNLGMQNARYDFISFLDADDFFLPGRFTVTSKVFENNLDCGGVYEAIGTVVEDELAHNRWKSSGEMGQHLITITKVVPPGELLERLVLGGVGYFSPDGFVFRSNLIKKVGLMDEELKLHQDNEFIFRLAAVTDLLPGNLAEPVAMRRVHQHNRITAPRSKLQIYQDRLKMWKSSYRWFRSRSNREQKKLISKALISYCKSYGFGNDSECNGRKFEVERRVRLLRLLIDFPELLFNKKYWVPFLPLRLQKRLNQ
jgi:glycosyltransferase involved in cell wall biosynthesis